MEHRSYKSHSCPNSEIDNRKVVVCEICSTAIETTGHIGDDEKKLLERHEKSGVCDPKKKKKATCPVRRCKEVLTFSNTADCKKCHVKVCLKHRFAADHDCGKLKSGSGSGNGSKFLAGMAARSGMDCGEKIVGSKSSRSVNVY